MKLILDKVKFYLPVFIALILSIVIFRVVFKKYKTKPKKTVEGFEEETTSMTILNELRTLLMNNETEYQNRMNSVLEKIVALEVQIRNEKKQNEESPSESTTEQTAPATTTTEKTTTSPATTTNTEKTTTSPATTTNTEKPTEQPKTATTTTTPVTTSTPKPPVNPPAQLNDDEDSDVESNVSDDEDDEDINEPFVDGITSCATANCYMI